MGQLEVIPDHIKAALEYHEIYPSTIKLAVNADLSVDGNYCDIWIAVTGTNLVILTGAGGNDRLKLFSGFRDSGGKSKNKGGGSRQNDAGWKETSFEEYPLEKVESLTVDNLASTGMLTARISGEDIAVCCFTNSHGRKVGSFVRLFEKIKQGQELTKEDFDEVQSLEYCPKCGLLYPEQDRKVCPKCIDRKSVFLKVLSFVPRYKLQLSLIILCMFLNAGFNLLFPYLSGTILFDQVLTEGGKYYGQVGMTVLVIVVARVAAQLVGIAYGRINSGMTVKVIFDLKTEIFSAMQRLSLSFYNKRQTGSLMTRINNDAEQLQSFFHDGLPYFIVNAVQIIGIAAVMFAMNWKLALLVFIPTPLIIISVKKLFPKLWKIYHRRYSKSSKLNALINDTLKGVRVVKAFGKEALEVDRFSRTNAALLNVDIGLGKLLSTMFPFLGYIMTIGSFIAWGFGGWEVVNGKISFGVLITFINYIGMLYGPLDFMTRIVDWWSGCMNSAQRIFEVIDAVPDITDAPNPVEMRDMKGNISFRSVNFSYEPNKPVLHDISFEIEAGKMLGIVGHSGAGKTTIANLINRLYDVDSGEITIDGVNVKNIALRDLRANIGVVSQETYLFMGTIAENIAYAKPGATMEEIFKAAKAAHAHDFIIKLPDGYDTVIGRGGRDLSGGERQRISIARAILYDPKILILDEATSAMDTETEGLIQDALDKLVKGRTTISIAHRLSTLRNADKLIVLDGGKIVESGTHSELIGLKGTYYRLVQKQSEALKMRGVGD
ncbi:ABC transporter transmembrane domain-containing protein [Pseudoclostridium thermosuccinogenes]|uniref:ABC transporter transmembrane domain-containing protein n=1 Tax=Clostridium thermosuccinogenes TaxID=84032 RepID=UPI002FD9C979